MAINFKPISTRPAKAKASEKAKATPSSPERKGIGGRPRKPDKLVAVTLRLPPDVVEHFKAQGPDWRARMAQTLNSASDPA
jgi:uncharacterized protein (DUF4415 family)